MKRSTPVGLVLTLGLTMGACGDDGPLGSGPAPAPVVVAGARAVSAPGGLTEAVAVGEAGEADTVGVAGVRGAGGDSSAVTGEGWAALDVRLSMPATVAVVGDSLTESAVADIEAAMSGIGVDRVIVDGLSRRRMARGARDLPPGTDAIDGIVRTANPDLWVIALGTNDVGAQVQQEMFRADAETLLERLPDDAPVIWVNLYIRWDDGLATDGNDIIAEVVDARDDSLVVDWYTLAETEGLITSDGVHLTVAGQRAFAGAMADAVADRALAQLPQRD